MNTNIFISLGLSALLLVLVLLADLLDLTSILCLSISLLYRYAFQPQTEFLRKKSIFDA